MFQRSPKRIRLSSPPPRSRTLATALPSYPPSTTTSSSSPPSRKAISVINPVDTTKLDNLFLFNYTSGRWLYNERTQLKCRYSPFDVAALHETVHRTTQSRVLHMHKKEGVFNKSFICTLEDGRKVTARIKNPVAGPDHLTTASEVATMDFVRQLGVPVPKVLAYNTRTSAHPVQAEFIIMENAPGVQLSTIWADLTPGKRKKVVDSLIAIEKKLLKAKFASYGSLYYKEDAPELSRSSPLFAHGGLHPIDGSRFCIGPSAKSSYHEDERASMSIDRGPWTSCEQYLHSIAEKEQAWIAKYAKPNLCDDPFRAVTGPQLQRDHIDALEQFRSVIPALVPKEKNALSSVLWHPDLNLGNIFVSEDGDHEIVQIIDWQGCSVGPAFLQMTTPLFLKYQSHTGSMVPSGLQFPKLPDNLSQLSADEKEQLQLRHKDKMLQKFYDLRQLFPYHAAEQDVISSAVLTAGRTWKEGVLPLQIALLNVAASWENLSTPDQPCPLKFTREQIRELQGERERWMVFHEWLTYLRSSVGVHVYGWVPSIDEYRKKRALLDNLIPESLRKEAEAVLPLGWWPFKDTL